ncbi:MAG: cytochrome P450 [Stigonema ocellatum SAG 48.90 = DSM 106950]|nr:cytochrome P450 [Stigonema ocellatum SAG 48.90 = DSM 106950]
MMAISRTPPGPSAYIAFSKSYRDDRLGSYGQAWKTYGDLIHFKVLPGLDLYLAVHPEAVGHILNSHGQAYKKAVRASKPLSLLLGEGIVISEGETWRRQRRLMQPAFHQQSLWNVASVMTRFAQKRVEMWESYPNGSVINLVEQMQQLTLEIVGEALFSADMGENVDSFTHTFRRTTKFIDDQINTLFKFPLWVPTPQNRQFIQNRHTLNRIAMNLIRGRRQQQSTPHDLLAMIMGAQDADTGSRMSDQELLDEVMTLLVAGHETVSVTLAWAFHLLLKHPEVLSKLQHEIEIVLNDRPPNPDDYIRLPYTRMIIEETLRLFPPAWALPRETMIEDEIQGYQIPKKALVLVPAYFTHRHPEFWENPEEFNPERFTQAETSKRHKFAYYPFGGGPRICIGNQFALMEATLVLSTLAQRFHLEPASDKPVSIDPTFTLRPKNDLPMRLVRR